MHDTDQFKKDIQEYYDIEEELGSGQFAVVRKIVEKETGDEFAGKYVRKKRTKASRNGMSREDIRREIEILRLVDHDKIIKVHDVYETDREMILVMELLRGGELFDYISKKDFLTEEEAIDFTRQILQGLQHLHSKNVVHLDLKPENILLSSTRQKTIKLVDFGLARVVNEKEQVREIMGTPEFVAPEVLNFDVISTATDMWALGVIAYILLSGASPFLGEDNQETFTNIIQVDYQFDEEYFSEISDEAKDFIEKLLIKDPRKRPTAHDCSRHTWVEEVVVDKKKRQRRRTTQICTFNFKRFVARKRWKMSYNKIRAMNMIAKLGLKAPPGFITEIPPMPASDASSEVNEVQAPSEQKEHKEHKKSSINRKKHKQNSTPKPKVVKSDSLTLKSMEIDIGEGDAAGSADVAEHESAMAIPSPTSPSPTEQKDYGSMSLREKRRARGQLRHDEIAKSKEDLHAKKAKPDDEENEKPEEEVTNESEASIHFEEAKQKIEMDVDPEPVAKKAGGGILKKPETEEGVHDSHHGVAPHGILKHSPPEKEVAEVKQEEPEENSMDVEEKPAVVGDQKMDIAQEPVKSEEKADEPVVSVDPGRDEDQPGLSADKHDKVKRGEDKTSSGNKPDKSETIEQDQAGSSFDKAGKVEYKAGSSMDKVKVEDKSRSSVDKPVISVDKAGSSVGKTGKVEGKPESSVDKAGKVEDKAATSVDKPGKFVSKPAEPKEKTEKPNGRAENKSLKPNKFMMFKDKLEKPKEELTKPKSKPVETNKEKQQVKAEEKTLTKHTTKAIEPEPRIINLEQKFVAKPNNGSKEKKSETASSVLNAEVQLPDKEQSSEAVTPVVTVDTKVEPVVSPTTINNNKSSSAEQNSPMKVLTKRFSQENLTKQSDENKPKTGNGRLPGQKLSPSPWQQKPNKAVDKPAGPKSGLKGLSKVSLKANRFMTNDKSPAGPKSPPNGSPGSKPAGAKSPPASSSRRLDATPAPKSGSAPAVELKSVACEINLDDESEVVEPVRKNSADTAALESKEEESKEEHSTAKAAASSTVEKLDAKSTKNGSTKALISGNRQNNDQATKVGAGKVTPNVSQQKLRPALKGINTPNGSPVGNRVVSLKSVPKSVPAGKAMKPALVNGDAKTPATKGKVVGTSVKRVSETKIEVNTSGKAGSSESEEELRSASGSSLTELTIRPRQNSMEAKAAAATSAGTFEMKLTIGSSQDRAQRSGSFTISKIASSSSSSIEDSVSSGDTKQLTSVSAVDVRRKDRTQATTTAHVANGKLTSASAGDVRTHQLAAAQGPKYVPQRDFSKYLNESGGVVRVLPQMTHTAATSQDKTQAPAVAAAARPSQQLTVTARRSSNPQVQATTAGAAQAKKPPASTTIYVPRRTFGFTAKTGAAATHSEIDPTQGEDLSMTNEKRWSQSSNTSSASSEDMPVFKVKLQSNSQSDFVNSTERLVHEENAANVKVSRKIENCSSPPVLSPRDSPVQDRKWKATLMVPKECEKTPAAKDNDVKTTTKTTSNSKKHKFANARSMFEGK